MAKLVDGEGDYHEGRQLAKGVPDPIPPSGMKGESGLVPGRTVTIMPPIKKPKHKVKNITKLDGVVASPTREFICPQCGQIRKSYTMLYPEDGSIKWRGNCEGCNIVWGIDYEEDNGTTDGVSSIPDGSSKSS